MYVLQEGFLSEVGRKEGERDMKIRKLSYIQGIYFHVLINTCPVSAIPHPALTYTTQIYEVEMQAILLLVLPLPPHLRVKGISGNERS